MNTGFQRPLALKLEGFSLDEQGLRRTISLAPVAADAFCVVVPHTLPGFIPVMHAVGTLAHAHLAIDTGFLVPNDVEVVVILVDGSEGQGNHLFRIGLYGDYDVPVVRKTRPRPPQPGPDRMSPGAGAQG